MSDEDEQTKTQVIQIPFVGGLQEKTQNEWIDADKNQVSLVNVEFTKEGSLAKRAGLSVLSYSSPQGSGSPYVSTSAEGLAVASWSQSTVNSISIDSSSMGALYSIDPKGIGNQNIALGPLPSCYTTRTGLPSLSSPATSTGVGIVTDVALTPVVLDDIVNNFRYIFWTQTNAQLGADTVTTTWLIIQDLVNGNPLTTPVLIYTADWTQYIGPAVITPVLVGAGVAFGISYVEVLLQFTDVATGLPAMLGLEITMAQYTGTASVPTVTVGLPMTDMQAADIQAVEGDPNYGYIVMWQSATLNGSGYDWKYIYYLPGWLAAYTAPAFDNTLGILSSPPFNPTCQLSAWIQPVAGGTGYVGFLYSVAVNTGGTTNYQVKMYVASAAPGLGELVFATLTAAGTVEVYQIGSTPAVLATTPFYVSGIKYNPSLSAFFVNFWQLQYPSGVAGNTTGIQCPAGLWGYIYPTGGGWYPSAMPLGCWPVGRPFYTLQDMTSERDAIVVYQPVIFSLYTLLPSTFGGSAPSYTPGSGLPQTQTQSLQATLYLLAFQTAGGGYALPVSTAAVRQVDPIFSFMFMNFPTGSLPSSSNTTNVGLNATTTCTRWAFGVRTTGADQSAYGISNGSSWVVQWSFNLDDQNLLYQNGEVAGDLHIAASCPMICDGTQTYEDGFFYYPEFSYVDQTGPKDINPLAGVYTYAVLYSCMDATGQVTRSSPVFTEEITISGGNTKASVVHFPPMAMSYRTLYYPGSINAEIYRTQAGGSTFYLIATVPAYAGVTPVGQGVASVYATKTGAGYSSAPTVAIDPPPVGGTQATATATISGGTIVGITVTDTGADYTQGGWPITFVDSTGTGASGTAIIGPIPGELYQGIIGIHMISGGSNYSSSTTVDLSAGSPAWGIGGAATPIITPNGQVTGFTVTNSGSGYLNPHPGVTLTGGGYTTAAKAAASLYTPVSASQFMLSFIDTIADANIVTATVLYTTGDPGPVNSVNPPSASMQCIHWNRLWIVDETLQNIWFTTQFVAGQAPVWNEELVISFPDGGDITGLASMDDKLIVFKRDNIYVIYGQGPSDNGQGSDLTLPQIISTDGGALSWKSICPFPKGLFYQSINGLYVLDRGLGTTWVGKDVVDTLASFPVVYSSTLVPTHSQVRFVCREDVEPSNGSVTLVYDYLVDSWTTFTYQAVNITSSMFVTQGLTGGSGGFFLAVDIYGDLFMETDGFYLDTPYPLETFWYTSSVTTAWIKLQGVQGYQRCRRVMLLTENDKNSGLNLSLAVNYNPQIVQAASWTYDEVAQLVMPQVEMHVGRRYNKQQAIQITVSDSPGIQEEDVPLGTFGSVFIALAIELQKIGDRYPGIQALGRR